MSEHKPNSHILDIDMVLQHKPFVVLACSKGQGANKELIAYCNLGNATLTYEVNDQTLQRYEGTSLTKAVDVYNKF